GRLFTQTGFSIDMTVAISPKSGPVGTPITVEVNGIGWRSLVNSWNLLYDNNFTGWISSVTTHGSARFTIPATGGPGVHILEVPIWSIGCTRRCFLSSRSIGGATSTSSRRVDARQWSAWRSFASSPAKAVG